MTCEAIDVALVVQWLADAEARGLVELMADARWHLTADGRSWYERYGAEHRGISVGLPDWRSSEAPLPRAARALRRRLGRRNRT
jgi:hypothetical protein